ncbi:serine/threonine protein kinase [Streptomyces sp. NPDC058067]|uniref:serine/threonine protein kinase n=1 Tax=Streptomyces sp. NPDC058067 TaxID=3346324 RepID=UPI0036EFFBB5
MHTPGAGTGVNTGAGVRGPAPRQTGPYTPITRLDPRASRTPVPETRYIARSPDGDRTVLVSVPLAGADPQRFMVEADASRYLLGPWAYPATDLARPGEAPWHARPYLPALPLPTALAVHGGPLPERTVRALGAALAETLAISHGQNLTHAGVSPAAVLLAVDGPRLTCFGAVRAAAPDGTARTGLPGLDPGSLPPEQASGGRPRPMGDVYALGATLAYAATSTTAPEREDLPPALRSVIGRCLARDPGDRPQLAELLEAFSPASTSPVATQTASRAAALMGPGWLPARVIAAIAHQSAALLAAEPDSLAPAARTAEPGPIAPAARTQD